MDDTICVTPVLHPLDAVLDRGMAAPAEALSDLGERRVGELSCEPYGHVTRLHESLVALVAHEVGVGDVVALLDELLDLLDGEGSLLAAPFRDCDLRHVLAPEDLPAVLLRGGRE